MEIRIFAVARLLSLAFILLVGGFQVLAQDRKDSEKVRLRPPSEQEFQNATDLVVPWRSAGCHLNFDFNEPNCYDMTGKEYQKAAILTLYNADGSLWYRFSVQPGQPDYFLRNTKMNFLPFSTDVGFIKEPQNYPTCGVSVPSAVILRMVGESKDWYKVEVNEETRETKFVLKSDKLWTKTSWSYWLFQDRNIEVNTDITKLYDKPDGEVIGGFALSMGQQRFTVDKVEGDWLLGSPHKPLFVPTLGTKVGSSWIRWRKGRDILVGSIFTGRKIPDIKLEDDDN